MEKVKFAGDVSVTIGTSATEVLEIRDVAGMDVLTVDIENTGSVALVDLYVQKLYHPNSAYRSFLGGSDFASLTNPNIEFVSSVKPHTLAGSALSQFTLWITGCIGVKIFAQADSGGTTVKAFANVQKNG